MSVNNKQQLISAQMSYKASLDEIKFLKERMMKLEKELSENREDLEIWKRKNQELKDIVNTLR